MIEKRSLYLGINHSPVIPILSVILVVINLTSYTVCAFIDPGYLPRPSSVEAFDIEKQNRNF